MNITRPDNDVNHLFPAFRVKLEVVLKEVSAKTGRTWVVVEGYRSQARQDYLYAQGRTRPGKIVTWIKDPKWHGCGLAADVAPTADGQVWYGCPHSYWVTLREVYKSHGLGNPAWGNGDLGHVQSLSNAERPEAIAWIKKEGI